MYLFQLEYRCAYADEDAKDDDASSAPTTTLFVKNLNFETTEDDFRAYFERCVAIRSARIATKKDPKHSGQVLSMGFGFVEFTGMCHPLDQFLWHGVRIDCLGWVRSAFSVFTFSM